MKFNKLQYRDLKMILGWRNDDNVRNKMKNQHVISFMEHEKWFYKTESDISCEWMIINYEGIKVGVVGIKEIDKNNHSCTWGMYLSPHVPTLGLGVLSEIKIIDMMLGKYNIQTIWGEVLSNNKSIMKIHKKCGFKIIKESDGMIIISMVKNGWEERKKSIVEEFMLK
jgi:UDP-4-amino-4,6-dideoxy-N-acetyl-beta-L-altrosamine N-acetyltransferase